MSGWLMDLVGGRRALCIPGPQPFPCSLRSWMSLSPPADGLFLLSLSKGRRCISSVFGHNIEKSLNPHLLKKLFCGLSIMEMRP